uniref:Uncharacterized protein n=1 Tax=Rhizophora mucronata TaxID=61149 RepID=A0A2P2J0N6_RHIMU
MDKKFQKKKGGEIEGNKVPWQKGF